MINNFTALNLIDLDLKDHNSLNLKCLAGRKGLNRVITDSEINRPGLTLSGFFKEFAFHRIQLFGRGEMAYLRMLEENNQMDSVEKMFTYNISCCILSNSAQPGDKFLSIAEKAGCALLQTDLSSSEFELRIIRALSDIFAPRKTIHGVLVEVFGIGVLITGRSGVGKSESALELIERGHRLIADDSVVLRSVNGNFLMGSGTNEMLGHHMEIRGLGILNISHLFGVGSIRDKKQIQLLIELETWDSKAIYDRIGIGDAFKEMLDVKVPLIKMPVKAGRNIPILIEVAAMNERLKKLGYYSAQEFDNNVLKWLESKNARNLYTNNNDIF
jgi:HPr kinase/phosphorylase